MYPYGEYDIPTDRGDAGYPWVADSLDQRPASSYLIVRGGHEVRLQDVFYMLDYGQLRALSAVIREGSFEKAARSLNITQSAVSQKIKLLEGRVGSVLIVRGKPCVATDAGRQLFQHSEMVRLMESDILSNFNGGAGKAVGTPATIRIAVNEDSLASWFTQVIEKVNSELGILLDIIPDDQEHTFSRLENGDVLAVVSSDYKPKSGFRSSSIGKITYLAVASPPFLKRNFYDGINKVSLSSTHCLRYDNKDMLPQRWVDTYYQGATNLTAHRIPSVTGYIQACLDGVGWAIIPEMEAKAYIVDGRLEELVPGQTLSFPLYWIYGLSGGNYMRDLSNIVVSVAAKHLNAKSN